MFLYEIGSVSEHFDTPPPDMAYFHSLSLSLLRTGDADLYVSSTRKEPTYDFNEHSLSSTSCGVDSVYLDRYYERPAYIGVYGHPRHEVCPNGIAGGPLVDFDLFLTLTPRWQ